MTKISREAFQRYENVRKSGTLNMLDKKVQSLAAITAEEQQHILRHYSDLSKEFGDEELPAVESPPESEELEEMFAEDSTDARASQEEEPADEEAEGEAEVIETEEEVE